MTLVCLIWNGLKATEGWKLKERHNYLLQQCVQQQDKLTIGQLALSIRPESDITTCVAQ